MVALPPGSRLGRYQVLEQIGRGGMATVFRAYDPVLDRHVALKVMPSFQAEDPTFVARFKQEAQAVAALSHPNIIQVHDFGEDKGFTFIVMEYLTGGTLLRHMTDPLPISEVLKWVIPLARALEYAHGEGIIHRDVKPANVLIDDNGDIKLSDFGLARLLAGSAGLTAKDTVLGTPEYMAPEQALGLPADQKSDLYSLGVIVYEMLVGRVPFHGDTPSETLMAHIHQPVPLPTSINPRFDSRLEAIVIRTLSKESADRYATAGQLVEALESAMAGRGTEADLGAEEAPVTDQGVATLSLGRLAGNRLSVRLVLLLLVIGIAAAGTTVAVLLAIYDSEPERVTEPTATAALAESAPTEVPAAPGPRAGLGAPSSTVSVPGTLLSTIFQRVHAIRGLEPMHPVVPKFISSNALRDRLLEAERQREEDVQREQAIASMLGLIPEDLDLFQLGLDLVDEPFQLGVGRAASYDRTTRELYIRDDLAETASFDDFGIFDEFEILVGYTMALLEQHFDVAGLGIRAESDPDRRAAIEALVIGDANTVGQEYMSAHITPDRFAAAAPPKRGPAIENAPEFVRQRALFAPQGGTNFIAALRKTGQWEAMQLVYKNPPVSTEQIIHPEKYLGGDEPVVVTLPDLAGALGPGWVEKHNGVIGESFLRAYLAQLSKTDFGEAAAGWGGDRFSLWERATGEGPSGERALVALFVWDTVGDARQFFELVSENAGQPGRAFLSAGGDSVLLIVGAEKAVDAIKSQFEEF